MISLLDSATYLIIDHPFFEHNSTIGKFLRDLVIVELKHIYLKYNKNFSLANSETVILFRRVSLSFRAMGTN